VKEKYSDFDIFIDDNHPVLQQVRKKFPTRTFVLPDYKTNKNVQGDNIYHVKTAVSDLKSQCFAIGGLEYRTNKLNQGIQELKSTQKSNSNSPIPI